jgi:hypothetical protein
MEKTIMSDRKHVRKGQPEALATFGAAARESGKKPGFIGLDATLETAAIPVNLDVQVDAATKVLREGVLGTDQGADAAINRLPDRVLGTDRATKSQKGQKGQPD